MKAFNPNDKDKLITMSIISEDLPNFFKAISSFDYKNKKIDLSFAKNLVFLYGYATSLECEYEETKKFFKQELKIQTLYLNFQIYPGWIPPPAAG